MEPDAVPPDNGVGGAARPTVSVVIPARNEAANLTRLLAAIPADVAEVLLVDGRSRDGTVAQARRLRPDIRIVEQTGSGKGNAMACGFERCRGDVIVMLDADCSTDPARIPALVEALAAGADVAKGSRFVGCGGSGDITRSRRHGNRALNGLLNRLYGTRYTDLCYGFGAFWAAYLPVLGLDAGPRADPLVKRWGDGFEVEVLINIRIARAGLRITEVPSVERARTQRVSSLHALSDGVRVLRVVAGEFRRAPGEVEPVSEPVTALVPPGAPARLSAESAG